MVLKAAVQDGIVRLPESGRQVTKVAVLKQEERAIGFLWR
jgi:hypothetical protein